MADDQIFDNQTRAELPVEFNRPEPPWKKFLRDNKIIIASVLALLAVGLIFWFFLSRSSGPISPTSSNVILQMKGPSQITSGNEGEYTVIYRNGENADLVDVSLELLFPSGFKFKSATPSATTSSGRFFNLPLVGDGEDAQVVFRGQLSGNTGEDKEIKARLHYKLSNFNSQFVVEQSIHTAILPPDLIMELSGPVDVVNGQDTTFNVNVTNLTQQQFDNLAIQLNYPPDFHFSSANSPASKDSNYWKLAKLASNSSVSLEITGSFMGSPGEEQLVRADLGQVINNNLAPQISATATFKIIPSSLSLKLSSDATDHVKLGDQIRYTVEYANQGNIGLSNLTVVVNLNGAALDMARLIAPNAIVTGNTLTWKAASYSNLSVLSPNEKGELSFSVPVRTSLNTNLKNQTISASASITSEQISKPTKSADVVLKLISQLSLDVIGDYVSGAAPMKVGQTTVFNLTFLLSNLSNDLTDTEVVASLPLPSSAWKNVIVPPAEASRLSFDPNSGKIKWRVGNLSAFTGMFTPALKVTFQLQVVPSETDKDRVMTLLRDISATGKDSFVNQSLQTQVITVVDTGTINDDVLNSKGVTVK